MKIPEEFVLIENYGNVIKDTREKLGINRKEFAEKLKEKEKIIKRIESNELAPDESLITRIEKLLNISLKEKQPEKFKKSATKTSNLTIGDIVEVS